MRDSKELCNQLLALRLKSRGFACCSQVRTVMSWNKAIAVGPNGMEASPSNRTFGHFHTADAIEVDETKQDLVGEPYAVVESDPGLSGLSRCGRQSHARFRRIYIYNTKNWCIWCSSQGGSEH